MGKGGGGGHTPVEAPESGRSNQRVKIIEIISEGEIEGLANGFQSIYLDGTSIQATDGSYNFKNIDFQGRVGSQDQTIIDGFNDSEKEISVATEVRKNKPITRTVTDSKVNSLRLKLGVKGLVSQNDQGDSSATRVDFRITVGNKTYPFSIEGKYSSQYLRDFVIDELPAVPFIVRLERLTDDSTSQRLQNATIWASYTEIIYTEFSYPNTALSALRFDSEYFSNIPSRTYEVKGIKVNVPSNYDPVTRAYNGEWKGTFKIAYSNNPAWVLYDLLTNKRYGLGHRLGEFSVDKWALYAAAMYCDQMVPDGFGGTEPRFTCNAWITDTRSAYDTIHDLCSVFRAMPVWNGTHFTVVMDRPADPVWVYNNANVINGEFSYQYSARKARHNAIQVEYYDARNAYEKEIEYVSDDEDIRRNGLNVKKISAFGCTSRGQAHRTGLWLLMTEKLEIKTVTFSVGREGLMHIPGDIIKVADNYFAGTNIGGRIVAVRGKEVTLDRDVEIDNQSYLSFSNADATIENIRITAVKNKRILTLASAPTGLSELAPWALTKAVKPQLYRAMTISENDDGSIQIVALQHEPQKEAIVDNGAVFDAPNVSLYKKPDITELSLAVSDSGQLQVNAEVSNGIGSLVYDIKVLKDGKLYAYHKGLTRPQLDVADLTNGTYQVIVFAKNGKGQLLSEKAETIVIDKPPVPTNVQVMNGFSDIVLSWDYVNDATMTEIFVAETDNLAQAKRVAKVNARMFSHTVGAQQVRYYWLRHCRGQNVSPWYQSAGLRGESAKDIDKELRLLNEKLGKNIVDQVFDVAAPARGLELVKTVKSLPNPHVFQKVKLIYNETDHRLYEWNGSRYDYTTPASEISGNILPNQLAQIPITKLSGQLTDAQILSLQASKLQGQIVSDQIQSVQAGKVQGQLANEQIRSIQADKISGQLSNAQISTIQAEKIQGQLTSDQIPTISVDKLQGLLAKGNIDPKFIAEVDKVKSDLSCAEAGITQLQKTQQDQAQSFSEKTDQLTARLDNVQSDGQKALSDYKAEIANYQNAQATKDQTQANVINDVRSELGNTKGQINTVKKTISNLDEKVSATYSLKTEVISGGKHALAGIAIGASADKRIAESSIIVMTDNFNVVKNKQDGNVKKVFSIANNKVVINGDLVADGSITTQKIAAKSITGEKLSASSVSASHIASGVIQTQHLQGDCIDGTKIRANSIASNHLQANSINSGHLQSNSITAGHIQSGAIRAAHIAAGELTTEKFAVGLGGNLLPNPILSNEAYGWDWNRGTQTGLNFVREFITNDTNHVTDWKLYNGLPTENIIRGIFWGKQHELKTNQWADVLFINVKVNPNKKYILSAYFRCYRCAGILLVEKYSSDLKNYQGVIAKSNLVGNIAGADSKGSFNHGLSDAPRHYIAFTAPDTGAVSLRFRVTHWHGDNPDLYLARPQLEEVDSTATQPSPWKNSGVTSIHGGSIVTNSITTQQLAAGAVTANEIASGAISARHIAANSIGANQIATKSVISRHIATHSIQAEHLNIRNLSAINSDLGAVTAGSIHGVHITGTTIEGGTIRGSRIEGITVEAENIIGDVMKAYSVVYNGHDNPTLTIPAAKRDRIAYLMPITLNSAGHYDDLSEHSYDYHWKSKQEASIEIWMNNSKLISASASGFNGTRTAQGSIFIPRNQVANIQFKVLSYGNGIEKNSRFVFFVANS